MCLLCISLEASENTYFKPKAIIFEEKLKLNKIENFINALSVK